MKKNLLCLTIIIACCITFLSNADAQCVPDTALKTVGFYPSPIPDGCQGEPYSEIIQFRFPKDTTITINPFPPQTVPFDSFKVDSLINVPSGLLYSCDNAGCVYNVVDSNQLNGCVTVSGTPTDTTAVTDSVQIIGIAYVTVGSSVFPMQLPINVGFKIHPAGDPACTATSNEKLNHVPEINIYPNPASSSVNISLNQNHNAFVRISLIDIHGKEVYRISEGISRRKETMKLDLSDLTSGIYLIRVNSDAFEGIYTEKLLVY